MARADVRVARVYDTSPDDGSRVLVDRLWPRGLTKEKASLSEWCKMVAPSTDLRRWYGHDPGRFDEFRDRYRRELRDGEQSAALDHLRELARHGRLTLLTASRDLQLSEAAVLADILRE